MKVSFKVKISVILLILILLPVFVTVSTFIKSNTKYIEENVLEKNMKLANNLSNQIDETMKNCESLMEMLANLDKVKAMNPEQMAVPLLEAVNAYPLVSQIYVMDKTGMQIYKTSGTLGDRSDRDYFQRAIKGETSYSDVIVSRSTNESIVVLAKPIKNNEEIVGVIGASIDLAVLSDYISQVNPGEKGYAFIVDNNGKVIAHPDKELVMEMKELSDLKPVQEVMKGKKDLCNYTYEGEEKLAAYVPVAKTGWGTIVQLPATVAFKEIETQKKFAYTIIVIALIVGLIVAFFVGRSITLPLITLTDKMQLAADGDLNAKLEGKILKRQDEFGLLAKGFNTMLESNQQILNKLREAINTLNSFSGNLNEIVEQNNLAMEQIATGTNQLASNAQENAEETTRGREAIADVSKGAEEVAKNAEKLNMVVQNTVQVAQKGADMMNNTADAISETAKSADDIEIKMGNLENSSAEISNFVGTIINIAEQTNLLALNAAIEAARAGESGRGFAVVAEEIRKLAEESNKSADQITKLVENIQGEVSLTSDIYRKTSEKLRNVVEKTQETKEQIERIVTDSNNALIAVEEIASVSEEQASALEEVTQMMDNILTSITETASTTQEMSASTEEQTASMQQITTMAQELKNISDEILNIINYFKN